jgi:hypothetical protein
MHELLAMPKKKKIIGLNHGKIHAPSGDEVNYNNNSSCTLHCY